MQDGATLPGIAPLPANSGAGIAAIVETDVVVNGLVVGAYLTVPRRLCGTVLQYDLDVAVAGDELNEK